MDGKAVVEKIPGVDGFFIKDSQGSYWGFRWGFDHSTMEFVPYEGQSKRVWTERNIQPSESNCKHVVKDLIKWIKKPENKMRLDTDPEDMECMEMYYRMGLFGE